MKVFRLKEYSVSGENSLSRCEAERLSAYLRKKKLQNVMSLTPQGIVSKSFVGVIRCGNVQIEILPKILSANDDRREIMENLVYMLSYTRRLDIRTESGARLAACKNPFLEILIYEYASSLFDCLKKQPLRNYVTEETEVNFIKGKLMLPHNVLAIRLQFNPIAFGSQYLVMRILYADDNPDGNDDLAALGCGEYEQDLFFRLRAAPVGLNIVAGPTGSGKSTLLQRNMIKLIKEKNGEINLLTVEDPPEYPIPGARQMPVTNANTEEEKTVQFTLALSAALRSDPDVLMVGEIRSLATASLTFKGALSGHLVWATLHANSAPAIVTRLRDMGVQSYMLSDPELLKGLISQRLFRKLCPYCRVPVKERLDNPAVKRLRTALGDFGVENTYLKGPGCKFCEGRGIKGRLGVQEMILPDGTFLELMIAGETRKAIDYWTGDLNGRTLKDAALERMLKGLIDLDEVERWCGLLDQRPVY